MKIYEVYNSTNLGTDEEYDSNTLLEFSNDCISVINSECGTKYPFLTGDFPAKDGFHYQEDDYPLPNTWIQALFVPYLSARIKQMDSSQFEYNDYYEHFFQRLRQFKERYLVPDEFLDGDVKPVYAQTDISGFFGMGGW